MKDKNTTLIEKLINDKIFLKNFLDDKTIDEQLKFLKTNGLDFNEEELKGFLKNIGEAYCSKDQLTQEDLENVTGGIMEINSKITAAALIFSAVGFPVLGQALQTVAWTWRALLPHNLGTTKHKKIEPSNNENSEFKNLEILNHQGKISKNNIKSHYDDTAK